MYRFFSRIGPVATIWFFAASLSLAAKVSVGDWGNAAWNFLAIFFYVTTRIHEHMYDDLREEMDALLTPRRNA